MFKNKVVLASSVILVSAVLVVGGVFASSQGWFTGKSESKNNSSQSSDKLKVTSSFYPLAFLVKEVGGDLVQSNIVVPTGVEAHEYEPTPSDLQNIYNSKTFVYLGVDIDVWAEKLTSELSTKGVKTLKIAEGVELKEGDHDHHEGEEHAGEEKEEKKESGEEKTFDPHVWLDPVLMVQMAKNVEKTLSEVDSKNSSVYKSNMDNLVKKLENYNQKWTTGLSQCSQNTIVTGHNAFAYMSARYGFTAEPIAGLSPDSQPSVKDLAELSEKVKAKGIKYVFTETLADPKLSETLAKEAGVSTLVLNPIEGLTDQEVSEGKTWFDLMDKNLENLRTALQCR